MSKSINSRDPKVAVNAAADAAYRAEVAADAVAPSTGQDGLDSGDKAKKAVENDPKGL